MLPILSSTRPRVVSASVFVLLILMACAQVLPAATLQGQSGRDSSDTEKPKQQKKKGLAPLRQEEAPDGSRVTITYNTPLSDYSAYRQGDRFVVVIPKADAPRVRSNLRGRGFDGVQVERRGDDAVLSFRIRPGTKARVDQQFNRLDVVFSTPEQPASNAAPNPGQTAAAPSQPSSGTASQTRQTRTATPQTPLSNHNSTADTTSQPSAVKPGGETAVATASTTAQPGVTTGTPAQSPAPSTTSSTVPAPSHASETTAAQPAPAVSPTASPASSGMIVARYWLPLLIALLLLMSAWAIVAQRRRAAEVSSTSAMAEPAVAAKLAGAETEMKAEAETVALPPENPAELALPGEEAEAVPVTEQAEETELAAMPLTLAVVSPVKDEARQDEAVELAAPASNGPTVAVVEASAARFDERAAPPATDDSGIPSNILRYLGSEDANERSAGVLGLADLLSDEAFGRIGAAFDDPSQQVRDAAARSLFNVSADRAASFKRLMRGASPERRRRVGEAIASSGMAGEAISDLSSESGERAFDALLVLSLMAKSGEVQSLIETIEEHPSTEVRLAIVKLLALSGRQEILESFRYLSTRDSLPIAVRSSIMEAIYQLNNPQPLPLSTA